jgi:hypothetical protein
MNLTTFKYVEDYIEYISGWRDASGLVFAQEPSISLARYDVNMVESLSNQSSSGIGYTDRQASLAKMLVLKYERQLLKKNISVAPIHENAEFRLPIRTIDRSTRLWIENDIVNLRFPFKDNYIESIRQVAKESRGFLKFDKPNRVWRSALTEHNLTCMYVFATSNQFDIDPEVEQLMQQVLAAESESYAIELQIAASGFQIINAAPGLIEYIENVVGGFGDDNILKLLDWSSILGYTVDKKIEELVIQDAGTRFYSLCTNNVLSLAKNNITEDTIGEIVNYARATDRLPIYLFAPDQSTDLIAQFSKYFDASETAILVSVDQEISPKHKLIYTSKIHKNQVDRIPLLVSGATMMFGGDRQLWVQQAEKVVYLNNEVYNPKYKGKTICRLD